MLTLYSDSLEFVSRYEWCAMLQARRARNRHRKCLDNFFTLKISSLLIMEPNYVHRKYGQMGSVLSDSQHHEPPPPPPI